MNDIVKRVESNSYRSFGFLKTKKFIGSVLAVMVLVLISCTSVHAVSFSWSGIIAGEDPLYTAKGTADFAISGSSLTVLLTNTSTDQLTAIGQALSAVTWDITNSAISLSAVSALISTGSGWVGVGAAAVSGVTDISGEWGFKDNLSAGSTLGSFGLSSVGDANFGSDTFGPNDRIDTSSNLFGPPSGSLGGVDGAIVGTNVNLSSGGFGSQGPFVQNQVLFSFNISGGTLLESEITNVNALYGSDGAPVIPEPATVALLGIGLVGLAGAEVRRRRKKRAADKS